MHKETRLHLYEVKRTNILSETQSRGKNKHSPSRWSQGIVLVATNVDDASTHNERTEIVSRINRLNADIAFIQETNGEITTTSNMEGYAIYIYIYIMDNGKSIPPKMKNKQNQKLQLT